MIGSVIMVVDVYDINKILFYFVKEKEDLDVLF